MRQCSSPTALHPGGVRPKVMACLVALLSACRRSMFKLLSYGLAATLRQAGARLREEPTGLAERDDESSGAPHATIADLAASLAAIAAPVDTLCDR